MVEGSRLSVYLLWLGLWLWVGFGLGVGLGWGGIGDGAGVGVGGGDADCGVVATVAIVFRLPSFPTNAEPILVLCVSVIA